MTDPRETPDADAARLPLPVAMSASGAVSGVEPAGADATATDAPAPLAADDVPTPLDGPRPLAPSVQTLWRLGLLTQAIVPSAVCGAATWLLLRPGVWSWTVAAALAPWLITLLLAVRLPKRRYAAWRYELTPDALRLGRGVMFRSESVVPYTRVQHVDTEQGPLERMLGLARVTVHTASGTSSSLTIPGLTPGDAEALRERLATLAGVVEPL